MDLGLAPRPIGCSDRKGNMAKTPEKKVKDKVTSVLKSIGAYYFYPVSGGYGRSGVPDIVGCYQGKFFGIECKAGKGKLTTLQTKNLQEIRSCDGIAAVVNEDNVHTVADILNQRETDERQMAFDF